MGSHVAPTRPSKWGLKASFWALLYCSGQTWLAMATTVHRFRPTSHSTFFFHMDPLTNDKGPGCYLQGSKIGPPYRAPPVST